MYILFLFCLSVTVASPGPLSRCVNLLAEVVLTSLTLVLLTQWLLFLQLMWIWCSYYQPSKGHAYRCHLTFENNYILCFKVPSILEINKTI